MQKFLKICAVVVIVVAMGGQAEAQQVLTFDEMSPDPQQNPILGSVVCANTSGLRFDSNHFHVIGPNFVTDFSSSGSTHIGYESGRGFPINMTRVGTGTFSLFALDAGEFYSSATVHPDFPDAEWITITGTRQDSTTVSHTIFLDGIRDGVGGVADFQHFVLPNTFVNLRSVSFTGWRQGNLDGGIALDNLQYTLSPAETLPACEFFTVASDIPVVSFVTPAAGLVSGTVAIQATASDNVGVTSVTFLLDGVALGPADTTAPYTFAWNTTTVADGPHTITAEARDASNNVGTAAVSVTVVNGTGGGNDPHYLEFDGSDDYVQVADAPAMSFGTGTADGPLTFEMWMRTDLLGKHQLIGKWGESTNQEYKLQIAAGTIRLDLKDQSANATASAFTANLPPIVGSWHHLAVTYDGRGGATAADGIAMYIDGAPLGLWRINDGAYVAMENLSAPVEIGREGPQSNQYDGSLDELRVWSVARTQSQIQAAMMTELTGTETGLVAYWRFNEGSGLVADDVSPGTSVGTLFNGTQWMSGGPLTPDTVPPVISNVATSNLTSSGVTITFTTNEPTTGWVSYTSTGSCPCTDVFSPAIGTSHSITLTGLTSDTLYSYQAKASDAANNATAATAATFHTLVQSSDTTPPTVSITSPAAGTVVGTVSVQATATDNVGVVSVQFLLDGVAVGAADTTAPYTYTWDTTTATDGAHTIGAQARDAANNVATASVNVVVQNTPTSTSPHYLDFDGVDDYLSVADAPQLSFGTGGADLPMTIEMWMRTDAIGKHQLIGKWGESTNQEYRVQIAAGTIRVDLRDQSANAIATVFTNGLPAGMVGTWHHLAVVYDGRGGATAADGIIVYIDGVSVALTRINDPAYVAMENLAAPVEIAREGPQWNQYDGALDEIRLWNVARTQGQIQAAMPVELTGTESGLVAYWRFNESSGTTSGDDSPSSHVATLVAGVVRVAGGPLAPDTTAPVISNIATSNLTATGVTISFTTNELTTGWVSYSATGACPCTDVFSPATGTSHSIALTGLTSDTLYTYWAKARDAATNEQTSTSRTVRTLVQSSDTTPPTVSITSPAAGTVVGTVSVQATATDNVGVVSVQFLLDGVAVGAADTTAPYTYTWDTTTATDGAHTIGAQARDAANNVATASVNVVVQNTPTSTSPHYLEFDGVDDYLSVADAPQLSFGTGGADLPMTIEMWMRTDAIGKHQLIGKWGESTNQEYRVQIAAGTIRVDLRDQSANAIATAFTNGLPAGMVGTWHHLAVVYDGRGGATAANGIIVYIDGVSMALTRINDPAYVAMENLAAPVEIAREGPQWNQYDGGLDEIRLWNVARTQGQIQAAMPVELTGAESGLVADWRFNESSGTTSGDDSPYSHVATLVAGVVRVAGGPLAPDTTAPVISNIATSNLTATGVTISFTTNELTTGWVSYSATGACPCTDVFSPATGTSHSITLSGLTADTLYTYWAKARDAATNEQTSTSRTVRTLVQSSDTTPPTVSITSPAAGAVVGTVNVQATASDNVGVVSVQFRVDGAALGAADTTAPYSASWNTTTVGDGTHTLTAEARDAANNVTTATVTVSVQNTPTSTSPHYLDFDGVDDYLSVADAPQLSFGTGGADLPMTIEMWMRTDAIGKHQVIGKWGESTNQEYRVQIAAGTIRVDLRDQSANAIATVFTNGLPAGMVGAWHHVAVVYDGRGGATAADGIIVYIDGLPVALTRINDPAYVAMENLAAPVEIGREGPFWNQYNGALDEIRLWSVARTQGQIQAAMPVELTGTESGLVGYWRFNEGTGGIAGDSSSWGQPATLTISPLWVAGNHQ